MPPSPHAAQRRIFGLDLMRSVAITGVVLGHGALAFGQRSSFPARLATAWAILGVDLFFALSGFLIGGILIRCLERDPTPTGLVSFWVRRWFRTVPNYALFLTVNVALAGVLARPAVAVGQYATFIQNLAWLMAATFFPESWSLAVEEWFYLTFPALAFGLAWLGFPGRCARRPVLLALAMIFATAVVARWYRVVALDTPWDEGIRKVVICRLDSLMWGVGAAALARWRPALFFRLHGPGLAVGLSLLLLLTLVLSAPNRDSWIDRSIAGRTLLFDLTGLAAACLLPAMATWVAAPRYWGLTVDRIAVWSYSIYLVNLPMADLIHRGWGAPAGVVPCAKRMVVYIIATIVVSAAVHRWYERLMTDLRDRPWFKGRSASRNPLATSQKQP